MRPFAFLNVSLIAIATTAAAFGDVGQPMLVEPQFPAIENGLEGQTPAPIAYPQPAAPTAYPQIAPPPTPYSELSPPSESWHVPLDGPPCPCDSVYRNSAWTASFEFIPTESHLTWAQFGDWPDNNTGFAGRLNLGYEDEIGLGIRGRFWFFGDDIRADLERVDLTAGKLDIDAYKRLYIDGAELALGAGPTIGALDFEVTGGDQSQFDGGGLSIFTELWHPAVRFERTDLGIIGRARYSMLTGRWKDDTGFVIAPTDHDSLSIVEAAFGADMRRRFGRRQDRYWFIRIVGEYQRWDSQWLGANIASAVAFTGTSIDLGVAW